MKKLFLKQNGFTLFELIVVIIVGGIVAGVVSFSVQQSIESSHVANVANSILADLRYAQEAAMSERTTIDFIFSGSGYRAQYNASGELLSRTPGQPTNDNNINETVDAVLSSGIGGTLQFDSWGAPLVSGSPFETGSDQIVVTIDGSKQIMLTPGTGYTYID